MPTIASAAQQAMLRNREFNRRLTRIGPSPMVNESVAPVCPLTNSEVPFNKVIPKIQQVTLISNNYTTNQVLNQVVNYINNVSSPTLNVPVWKQVGYTTKIVRIANPDDPTMWVDVERIMQVNWAADNGEKLTWIY
jgi:hypothetical protein